ncbi:MAG: hypothetical protein ACU0CO_09525 [Shimia sp.]
MRGLEDLGRVRLSANFWMREFLHSEIGSLHGIPNVPERPDLAIAHGRRLCEDFLEPLQATFGRLFVRSGYRSPTLNAFGNENGLNCARNDNPLECHVWDFYDDHRANAGASIVVPWFADRYAEGRDWRDLAWWMWDHLPPHDTWFFPKLCAFNIAWRATPRCRIDSYVAPKGTLVRPGVAPEAGRAARYADFPPLRGIETP